MIRNSDIIFEKKMRIIRIKANIENDRIRGKYDK